MRFRSRPRFDVAPGGTLTLGDGVKFGRGTRVHVGAAGELVIGDGTVFDEWCLLAVHERVTIGPGCRFGEGAAVFDFEPDPGDADSPTRKQPLRVTPVTIGAGVMVGTGAVVMPGAEVPDDAIVEAKQTVGASLPR